MLVTRESKQRQKTFYDQVRTVSTTYHGEHALRRARHSFKAPTRTHVLHAWDYKRECNRNKSLDFAAAKKSAEYLETHFCAFLHQGGKVLLTESSRLWKKAHWRNEAIKFSPDPLKCRRRSQLVHAVHAWRTARVCALHCLYHAGPLVGEVTDTRTSTAPSSETSRMHAQYGDVRRPVLCPHETLIKNLQA